MLKYRCSTTTSGSASRHCSTQEPKAILDSECLPLLYASTNASPAFMKRIQMFCMTIAYLSGGHRVKGAASR
jgi:hypothetical protein